MRLFITDLTDMQVGYFCIAGWDTEMLRMVRPLPGGGHWPHHLVIRHDIVPGVTVEVTPTGRRHPGNFPHTTEDLEVEADTIRVIRRDPVRWFGAGAPPTAVTISEAFAGNIRWNNTFRDVRQGVHVLTGTEAPSLAAISAPPASIEFLEVFGKLKAIVNDGEAKYQLAVSCHRTKIVWHEDGIDGVRRALPDARKLHVRLGLARGFGDEPEKCYMMINGIHG